MYSDINLCHMSGRIATKPIVREIKGSFYIQYMLAINTFFKYAGTWRSKATFIPVEHKYKRNPSHVAQYLKKGTKIYLLGSILYRELYDMNKSKYLYLNVKEFRMLEKSKDNVSEDIEAPSFEDFTEKDTTIVDDFSVFDDQEF